jgi:putative heme-binding domain-containing protein
MWRLGCVLLVCMRLAADSQTPTELFRAHCASCHGRAGEGSRGPSLKVPTLKRANDADSLTALLRRGVPGTEMPAIAPELVADQSLHDLAVYVLSLRTTRGDTASGKIVRGAGLFRDKGKCMGCHRVRGEGSASAPDLTDIGRMRDTQWLRKAIVAPESNIYDSFADYRWTISMPDNYLLVEVVTTKGERVAGARLNEDAFSLQVRDGDGRIRSFLRKELTEVRRQWGKSPMPSYRDVFSPAELDDLVGYLAGQRGLE